MFNEKNNTDRVFDNQFNPPPSPPVKKWMVISFFQISVVHMGKDGVATIYWIVVCMFQAEVQRDLAKYLPVCNIHHGKKNGERGNNSFWVVIRMLHCR